MYLIRAALLVGVVLVVSPLAAQAPAKSPGCLYSTQVGNRTVQPCTFGDPLGIGNDADVKRAMKLLALPDGLIRFQGCSGTPFSVAPASTGGAARYVITYPSDRGHEFLAPVIHELAHVLQMERAGGLDPLRRKFESRRIELEADFVAGLVFANALQGVDMGKFQHNLSLIGAFFELDTDAHGRPDQRTAAFRVGANLTFPRFGSDITRAAEHFQSDLYGRIISF